MWSQTQGHVISLRCCSTDRFIITLHESVIIPHTHQMLSNTVSPSAAVPCSEALQQSGSTRKRAPAICSSCSLECCCLRRVSPLEDDRWIQPVSQTWVQHPGQWTLTNPEGKNRGRSHLTALPFKWPAACLPVVTQSLMRTPLVHSFNGWEPTNSIYGSFGSNSK